MSMSDLEQKQMVKSWIKEYGYYILFSIVVFLAANFGWRYWLQYKNGRLESATLMYSKMIEANDEKKEEEAKLYAQKLIKDYSKSIYAAFASLMLAKDYVESGDLKSAKERLNFVVKNSPSENIEDLARFRLARVLVAMKEPEQALDLLPANYDGVYAIEFNEARGDALLKLGKNKEAEEVYRKALELSKDKKIKSPLLKMKLQQF